MATETRNYSTISPSAAFLLQLKAYTDIPFAKEAAELMENEEMKCWIKLKMVHREARRGNWWVEVNS